MNREQKIQSVAQIGEALAANPHLILASFRGLTVNQATELRGRIREVGGRYRVVQNRLAKLAAEGTPAQELATKLDGPCALVSHESDPVALAKALSGFAKENPQLQMLAALVDAKELIDAEGVKELALLPGLDELRAQLLSLIQTPATTLVRLLSTPASQVARAVDARSQKLGEES